MTDEMVALERIFTMGEYSEEDVVRYEKLKREERLQLLESLATKNVELQVRVAFARGMARRTSDMVHDMLDANAKGLEYVDIVEGIPAEDKIVLEDLGFVVEGSTVKFKRGK